MSIYKFYIYAYLREDGTPYYIGKGQNNRAYVYHKGISVPKDKSRIVFYQTGLLESDAFNLEIKYIKLFGRKDLGTGILRNLTNGGDGVSGHIHSEEHKQKLREAMTGKKLGPLSEETRQKISEANKGKIISEETRQKLRVQRGPQKNPCLLWETPPWNKGIKTGPHKNPRPHGLIRGPYKKSIKLDDTIIN